ncbi:hypothetical protein ACH5RR_023007 [Cinchona calisaya]|uniref:Synergin gamma C-terminal domain-containing protein n=1 Tax=Cinchona calisaya TaxID=153742 RepID=A0ABD2ZCU8_9GENT
MAEDDDDDSFGDFSFASFNSSISHQINGLKFPITTASATTAAAKDDDDGDEWGDFIETPLGSFGSSNTPSTKSIDPLNFFAPNPISRSESAGPNPVEPGSDGVQPPEVEEKKESQWVKLKGAIPLSVFGDLEEEEEKDDEVERSGGIDPHDIYGKDSKFDQKKNDNFSNGFKSNGFLGGSFSYDVIASLYNQPANLNNGSNSGSSLSNKDSSLELGGLNLESGSVAKKSDNDLLMNLSSNYNKNQEMEIGDGVSVGSNGISSNLDALDLDFGRWNTGFSGVSSMSSLDLVVKKNLDDQSQLSKGENGNAQSNSNGIDLSVKDTENSHFSRWNSYFDGFKSNLSVMESSLHGSSFNVNGVDMLSDFRGGNEELGGGEGEDDDDNDDGWEFQDAYVESKDTVGNEKARSEVQESLEKSSYSSGIVNDTNRSIDLFSVSNGPSDIMSTSNGIFSKSDCTDVGSNIKSISAAGNNLASDTCLRSDQRGTEVVLYPHPVDGIAESDEDFGEFAAAFSGTGLMQEADSKLHDNGGINASSSGFTNGSKGSVDFFSVYDGAIDLFAPSNGISSEPSQVSVGFDIKPSIAAKHEAAYSGPNFDAFLGREQTNGGDMQDPHTVIQNDASDESIGEFTAAFAKNALMKEEKDIRFDNHKSALPLSIFGDEELESDGSLNADDGFMLQPSSSKGNSYNPNSAISINDLISNLYSQAEPISPVGSMQEPVVNGLDLSDSFSGPNLVPASDDVDSNSWEFKDAIFQSEAENGSSLSENEDVHQRSSGKLKLQILINFYSKLQDELYFIAKGHLASLKETQSNAISGEDSNLATLIDEIQEACGDVGQGNAITKEEHLDNAAQRHNNLLDFLEVLQEPEFHVLETEYDLQRRLSLVEKDARLSMELIDHVKSMLKILTMGSLDEQYTYVSMWSKIIYTCAQELQHGAQIWSQSLQKNIQYQMLAEPQGKTFVLALGEIYRVAVLLGATAKLYKPWILLTATESSSINSLLDQCQSSWSASGLEEALASILNSTPAEKYSSFASLVDSIKYICNLDTLALQNQVLIQQESLCRLSLMPQRVAPGMTMVVWDEEQCFLKLANLWVNLISSDRPKLPPLHVNG